MSQKERQPWGAATAVVAPPPKTSAGAAALRAGIAAEIGAVPSRQWEALYLAAAPGKHADLLALASQQGLLYSYQVPAAAPPSPQTSDEPRAWNLLGKMLAGQFSQLEPLRAAPISVFDEALDENQQHAVAVALATPDVCLIQGLPGAGKSRVTAEIVTQAALRGQRVLLVAPHAASLDCVLEQVAPRDNLCPIRCVAPGELVAALPAGIRALTWSERTASVRSNTLRTARETRQAAELQCARRRHEEPIWPRLEEMAVALATARDALARTEIKLAAIEKDVFHDVDVATGRLATEVRGLRRAADEQAAQMTTDMQSAQQRLDDNRAKLAEMDQAIAALQPLADAKQKSRWWTGAFWKAVAKGNIAARSIQLQVQRQELELNAASAEKHLQELVQARVRAEEKAANSVHSRLRTEIEARQAKVRLALHNHQNEIQRHESLWTDLLRQIDPESLRPGEKTVESVRAARELWQHQRQEDEARSKFVRDWAEFLETSGDALAARLPGYANLVAATPAGLSADPHFGDPAASGGQFDLLVIEDAEQFAESDFLKTARRARQWVLIGEPDLLADAPRSDKPSHQTTPTKSATPGHFYHQLWDRLHCDPSQQPCGWFREKQRLGCRLRPISPLQRQAIESEPLADAPDVELRILSMPHKRPVLAEVLFSNTMSVPQAKEFLFRELQEIAVQTSARGMRWHETPEKTVLHFSPTPSDFQAVALDQGVREYLCGPHLESTCKLEFDRGAGWDRAAVEKWVELHLGLRDLGRTACLDHTHRMTSALAAVVFDWLGLRQPKKPADQEKTDPAVEFVPVLGSTKGKPPGRPGGRVGVNPESPNHSFPSAGSGLELDLALTRSTDRLPSELRPLVTRHTEATAVKSCHPIVNLPEARAVVRKLEDLVRQKPAATGQESPLSLAVVALFPAQAELIRHLIQQCPRLARHADSILVGTPAAFRQRQADVVVISLTRSHVHRAVAYGDGPAGLIMALTRARRRLILLGDPGNLVRRSQWRGGLDHLPEGLANREAQLLSQVTRYLHDRGRFQRSFRVPESGAS